MSRFFGWKSLKIRQIQGFCKTYFFSNISSGAGCGYTDLSDPKNVFIQKLIAESALGIETFEQLLKIWHFFVQGPKALV